MPAQLGEIVTFVFDFTVAGVPTSGLSPAPVITIYSPAGVALVSAAAMTEQVTPARYIYTYTLPNVAGLYEARAFSSQANLDSQYMSCGLEVGQAWIQDLDAAISTRTKPADTQAAVTLVTTTTNLTNAPTNGDFTATMKTSLNAATPASVVGAVGSVTGNVGGNVLGGVGGNVLGSVGSVVADVGITQAAADKVWNTASRTLTSFGTLVADIWSYATRILTAGTNIVLAKGTGLTGLNDISTTQVHTEVVNGLAVDTYAEPVAVPAATASLKDKIGWIMVMARNKLTQTNTVQTVYADDTTTPIATAAVSDDGTTATRGEMT